MITHAEHFPAAICLLFFSSSLLASHKINQRMKKPNSRIVHFQLHNTLWCVFLWKYGKELLLAFSITYDKNSCGSSRFYLGRFLAVLIKCIFISLPPLRVVITSHFTAHFLLKNQHFCNTYVHRNFILAAYNMPTLFSCTVISVSRRKR